VQIRGDLSAELLVSIFQITSPIHDGAVIIKGYRILAAGCILPLASELSTKKILGTRHRAAIGITEVSDACAIVVSEQSGRISLGHGKDFDSNIDVDKLKRKLVAIYKKA
jgi:diadenylate cyclase